MTAVALVAVFTGPAATAEPLPRCTDQGWVGVWEAAPSDASRGHDTTDSVDTDAFDQSLNPKSVIRNNTARAILTPTFGGSTTRVRLSNRFGAVPVTFTHVTIALRATESALVPGTAAPLTFNGGQSVTVAPGHDVVSDPVGFSFDAFQSLAVSVYVAGDVGKPTEHYTARQTSYLTPADAGDHTQDVDGGAFTQRTTARPFVTGIEVLAPRSTGAVVALGDSITDGYQQPAPTGAEAQDSLDADGRWPDVLARRLLAANRSLSVLNAGIAGNAVMQDGTALGADVFGPAAVHRLDGDVFNQAGVTTVILLEGINDLAEPPISTVDQLLGGYRQLIGALHSRGLRVLQGTITPVGGLDGAPAGPRCPAPGRQHLDPREEPCRRSDRLRRGSPRPGRPARINPVFDGGDHLHFNLAGYLAMGDAIPLELLANPACS